MENIVTSLKIRCVQLGTNLTRLCEAADVDRDLLVRWEKEEPKSLKTLRKLEQTLSKMEQTAKAEKGQPTS